MLGPSPPLPASPDHPGKQEEYFPHIPHRLFPALDAVVAEVGDTRRDQAVPDPAWFGAIPAFGRVPGL